MVYDAYNKTFRNMRRGIFSFLGLFLGVSFLMACGEDDFFLEDVVTNDTTIISDTTFVNDTTISNGDTIIKKDTIVNPQSENNRKLLFSLYMNQSSGNASVQGAACYDKYLFQFENCNSAVFIYDMEAKAFVDKIVLVGDANNHCNNASFSNIYYDPNDKFPLIYVSGGTTATYNKVQVYRIQDTNGHFSIIQVQEIMTPPPTTENQLTWGCVSLDNKNRYLYFYGGTASRMQYAKFKIPDIKIDIVSLHDNDILEQFSLPSYIHPQGATIYNDFLYIVDGVPGWGDKTHLKIIDLKKKEQKIFDILNVGFRHEPEGVFFYQGELFLATNFNAGVFHVSNYE